MPPTRAKLQVRFKSQGKDYIFLNSGLELPYGQVIAPEDGWSEPLKILFKELNVTSLEAQCALQAFFRLYLEKVMLEFLAKHPSKFDFQAKSYVDNMGDVYYYVLDLGDVNEIDLSLSSFAYTHDPKNQTVINSNNIVVAVNPEDLKKIQFANFPEVIHFNKKAPLSKIGKEEEVTDALEDPEITEFDVLLRRVETSRSAKDPQYDQHYWDYIRANQLALKKFIINTLGATFENVMGIRDVIVGAIDWKKVPADQKIPGTHITAKHIQSSLDSVKVHYHPDYFKPEQLKDFLTFKHNENDILLKSKFKLVSSKVHLLSNIHYKNDGKPPRVFKKNPTTSQLTTTILSIPGIDLSCEAVDSHLLNNNNQLDGAAYRAEFRKMVDLIFQSAIASGVEALILVPIGCGVFAGSQYKQEVIKIVAEEYAAGAARYAGSCIKRVIVNSATAFDGGEEFSRMYEAFANLSSTNNKPNSIPITLVNKDQLSLITELESENIRTAMLNAADHKPVAGKYCFYYINKNQTGNSGNILQEEQLGLDTTLALVQSPYINAKLNDMSRYYIVNATAEVQAEYSWSYLLGKPFEKSCDDLIAKAALLTLPADRLHQILISSLSQDAVTKVTFLTKDELIYWLENPNSRALIPHYNGRTFDVLLQKLRVSTDCTVTLNALMQENNDEYTRFLLHVLQPRMRQVKREMLVSHRAKVTELFSSNSKQEIETPITQKKLDQKTKIHRHKPDEKAIFVAKRKHLDGEAKLILNKQNGFYDFESAKNSQDKIAWVDAASHFPVGGGYTRFGFTQEERMFLTEFGSILPILQEQDLDARNAQVIIAENIPNTARSSSLLYGRGALANWRAPMNQTLSSGTLRSSDSIAIMAATNMSTSQGYTQSILEQDFKTFFTMFSNLKKSDHKIIHTLPIGAGAFQQSVLVSITLQAIAALQADFELDKLIFHEITDEQQKIVQDFLQVSADYRLSTAEMIEQIYCLGRDPYQGKFTNEEKNKLGKFSDWQTKHNTLTKVPTLSENETLQAETALNIARFLHEKANNKSKEISVNEIKSINDLALGENNTGLKLGKTKLYTQIVGFLEDKGDFDSLMKTINSSELEQEEYKPCRTFIFRLQNYMMDLSQAIKQGDQYIIDMQLTCEPKVTDEHLDLALQRKDLSLFLILNKEANTNNESIFKDALSLMIERNDFEKFSLLINKVEPKLANSLIESYFLKRLPKTPDETLSKIWKIMPPLEERSLLKDEIKKAILNTTNSAHLFLLVKCFYDEGDASIFQSQKNIDKEICIELIKHDEILRYLKVNLEKPELELRFLNAIKQKDVVRFDKYFALLYPAESLENNKFSLLQPYRGSLLILESFLKAKKDDNSKTALLNVTKLTLKLLPENANNELILSWIGDTVKLTPYDNSDVMGLEVLLKKFGNREYSSEQIKVLVQLLLVQKQPPVEFLSKVGEYFANPTLNLSDIYLGILTKEKVDSLPSDVLNYFNNYFAAKDKIYQSKWYVKLRNALPGKRPVALASFPSIIKGALKQISQDNLVKVHFASQLSQTEINSLLEHAISKNQLADENVKTPALKSIIVLLETFYGYHPVKVNEAVDWLAAYEFLHLQLDSREFHKSERKFLKLARGLFLVEALKAANNSSLDQTRRVNGFAKSYLEAVIKELTKAKIALNLETFLAEMDPQGKLNIRSSLIIELIRAGNCKAAWYIYHPNLQGSAPGLLELFNDILIDACPGLAHSKDELLQSLLQNSEFPCEKDTGVPLVTDEQLKILPIGTKKLYVEQIIKKDAISIYGRLTDELKEERSDVYKNELVKSRAWNIFMQDEFHSKDTNPFSAVLDTLIKRKNLNSLANLLNVLTSDELKLVEIRILNDNVDSKEMQLLLRHVIFTLFTPKDRYRLIDKIRDITGNKSLAAYLKKISKENKDTLTALAIKDKNWVLLSYLFSGTMSVPAMHKIAPPHSVSYTQVSTLLEKDAVQVVLKEFLKQKDFKNLFGCYSAYLSENKLQLNPENIDDLANELVNNQKDPDASKALVLLVRANPNVILRERAEKSLYRDLKYKVGLTQPKTMQEIIAAIPFSQKHNLVKKYSNTLRLFHSRNKTAKWVSDYLERPGLSCEEAANFLYRIYDNLHKGSQLREYARDSLISLLRSVDPKFSLSQGASLFLDNNRLASRIHGKEELSVHYHLTKCMNDSGLYDAGINQTASEEFNNKSKLFEMLFKFIDQRERSAGYKLLNTNTTAIDAANALMQVINGRKDIHLTAEIYSELLNDSDVVDALNSYLSISTADLTNFRVDEYCAALASKKLQDIHFQKPDQCFISNGKLHIHFHEDINEANKQDLKTLFEINHKILNKGNDELPIDSDSKKTVANLSQSNEKSIAFELCLLTKERINQLTGPKLSIIESKFI